MNDQFEIPAAELERMQVAARFRALSDSQRASAARFIADYVSSVLLLGRDVSAVDVLRMGTAVGEGISK